jgi:hypothetical protein
LSSFIVLFLFPHHLLDQTAPRAVVHFKTLLAASSHLVHHDGQPFVVPAVCLKAKTAHCGILSSEDFKSATSFFRAFNVSISSFQSVASRALFILSAFQSSNLRFTTLDDLSLTVSVAYVTNPPTANNKRANAASQIFEFFTKFFIIIFD